ERLEHDRQVVRYAAAADVLEIEAHLVADIVEALVVRLIDLRPAGDTGLGKLPQRVILDRVAELREDRRALRTWADDVHLALDDVDELWNLVDAQLSK